jgi:hypothetical protein
VCGIARKPQTAAADAAAVVVRRRRRRRSSRSRSRGLIHYPER